MNSALLRVTGRSRLLFKRAASSVPVPLSDTVSHPRPPDQFKLRQSEQEVQVSKLSNGVTVASLDGNQVNTKVGVLIRAGSRYESYHHRGVTHLLSHCAGISTRGHTEYRISRELGEMGSRIKSYSNREHVVYSVDFPKGNSATVAELLGNIVCKPSYFPWEVALAKNCVTHQIEQLKEYHEKREMEILHWYGFRNGLSNSIYCSPHTFNKLASSEEIPDQYFMEKDYTTLGSVELKAFTGENFLGKKTTVVGLGIGHSELVGLAEQSFSTLPEGGECPLPVDEYIGGGEWREMADIPTCRVMLGCKSVGLCNTPKEVFAARLLQCLLVGDSVKNSGNSLSRLVKAGQAAVEAPFDLSGNSLHYTDTGLFVISMATHGDHMSPLVKAVVKEFGQVAKGDVSDAEVARIKSQVKTEVAMGSEEPGLFESIGVQAGLYGSYTSLADTMAILDTVTKQDIIKFAQVMLNTRANMTAYGNLSNTPRLDEILAELKK